VIWKDFGSYEKSIYVPIKQNVRQPNWVKIWLKKFLFASYIRGERTADGWCLLVDGWAKFSRRLTAENGFRAAVGRLTDGWKNNFSRCWRLKKVKNSAKLSRLQPFCTILYSAVCSAVFFRGAAETADGWETAEKKNSAADYGGWATAERLMSRQKALALPPVLYVRFLPKLLQICFLFRLQLLFSKMFAIEN
jgi:hypothetical protein